MAANRSSILLTELLKNYNIRAIMGGSGCWEQEDRDIGLVGIVVDTVEDLLAASRMRE
jgi:hypothetical protein